MKNKKRISILLAAALILSLLAGCGNSSETDQDAGTDTVDYTTGTPWLCSILEGNVTADTESDLKDDFYLAVNKDELVSMEFPEGLSATGTMYDVMLQTQEETQALFSGSVEAKSHDAKLALDLYNLYMDWDGRNKLGLTPLRKQVDKVEAIDSLDGLNQYLLKTPYEEQLFYLLTAEYDSSREDSSKNIITLLPPGLTLEDPAEYTELTEHGQTKRDANKTLAVKMLKRLGYSEEDADQKYENCLAFEALIAPSMFTNEEAHTPDYSSKTNNHFTRDDMAEAEGSFPVVEIFEDVLGYPAIEDMLVFETEWLKKMSEVYTEENLTLMKDFMIVHGVIDNSLILDREAYEDRIAWQNAINGSTGSQSDEIVFSDIVASQLDWAVSRLYCDTYLTQADKDRISDMIDEIKAEYHGIIEEADFLSEDTRAKAIEKLDAMGKKVLWPDDWSQYSFDGLNFASVEEGGNVYDAVQAIAKYNQAKNVEKYSKPVDKYEWLKPPTFFNCAYHPQTNTMYIFGIFARGNIYNSDMSDEELYGRLGYVIGHEISHGFDSTGAQFDKDGNMKNWWTDEDSQIFQERNAKLEAYLSSIHPWEGQDLTGSIMTGEACADMAGLKVMLRIAAKKENFDYDKFFRSYADLWRFKTTKEGMFGLFENVHPLYYIRVNGFLQQYDEFLDFYGIKPGDGMYLAPDDRVNIW